MSLPTEQMIEKDISFSDLQFSMRLHPAKDGIMNPVLLRDGIWEPTETAIFMALLASSETVFDIGANIGWYSLVAGKALGDRGRVLAFEPEPAIGAILDDNIARNGLRNVDVFHAAVADRKSTATFVSTPDHVGDHHLSAGGAPVQGETYQVDVVSIDNVSAGLGRPVDLIKMDTQGAELAIARGMEALLRQQSRKPVLISEFWPFGMRRFDSDPAELIAFWERHAYRPYLIDDGAGVLRPTSFASLRHRALTDLAPTWGQFVDLVLMPEGDARQATIEPFIRHWNPLEAPWRELIRPSAAHLKRRLFKRVPS